MNQPTAAQQPSSGGSENSLWTGLARAFGGAIFFALPLLMTMEMWWLGFYMNRVHLALFMALMIPLLIGLDHFSGFRQTSTWKDDAADGIIAYGVGFVASTVVLYLFSVIDFGSMPLREIVGKVSLQAIPASFGAVLANSQLAGDSSQGRGQANQPQVGDDGYGTELFFMLAGAIFLAFNVAPTDEMIVIAFKMSQARAVVLMIVSILLMHAFVYSVSFGGTPSAPRNTPWWSLFLRFTVVGYAISLLVSAYILWTFGHFEGTVAATKISETVVLAFPASLGAAAARLIL